jgi:hypothetical protein
MAQTGRKPYDTTDVALYGTGSARLRPPASLGEPEKRAFLDLVTTVPAGQFRPSDLPLLCRWAELTVMAETAAGELAVSSMVTATARCRPGSRSISRRPKRSAASPCGFDSVHRAGHSKHRRKPPGRSRTMTG